MKKIITSASNRQFRLELLLLAACLMAAPPARAGLTLSLLMYHGYYDGSYTCYPGLSTNSASPSAALGGYVISSPSNSWSVTFQLTGAGLSSPVYNNLLEIPDFNSFYQEITNKYWTILVTNAVSTNLYNFTVSTTGFNSNSLPVVSILFPPNGAVNVTNNPTFTWQGPSSWSGYLFVEDYNDDYSFYHNDFPPVTQTNWTSPVALPNGHNNFYMYYDADALSSIVASTPTNSSSQAISGWASTASLEVDDYSSFTVTNLPGGSGGAGGAGGHTNVAYYSFEDDNLLAHDFSGHGNNMYSYGYFNNATNAPYLTNNAAAGSHAVGFTGLSYLVPPTNLVATLAGSFSVSLRARTSAHPGNDSDPASSDAGLLAANYDQVIPMALTGSKLAFLTGGGSPDTLHSATAINIGNYVHLVVTRDEGSGEKKIYVNGALDNSDLGATGQLNSGSAPTLYLGYNSSYSGGLAGDMDEVQIYSGVLSSNEVLQLYNNPGTTVADTTSGGDLATALNATNLTWSTSGDSNWFVETTNTYDGVSAAQSGIVTNNQSSVLSTTVNGPGTLMFWWSTQTPPDDNDFGLEFSTGYNYLDIYNVQPWVQQTVNIPAGQYTLTWTAYAGDYASDAGFVDQVSFTPTTLTTVLRSALFHPVVVNDQSVLTPGGGYWVEPYLFQVQPEPLTVDEIASPNEQFTYFYTNEFTAGALHRGLTNSWAEVANECTNGLWTLYVNKGDPSERQFKFAVSLDGLNTNLLKAVTILFPADGSVNVATNTPIEWSVPNSPNGGIGVDILQPPPFTYLYSDGTFPASATNWIPTGPLNYGTNFAEVEIFYPSPAIATITPTNGSFDVISNWTTTGEIETRSSDSFVVGAPAPLPVQLFSSPPITSGGDFLLSFQTLAGRPETVQISTNLMTGWMDVTNFIGDGSVQQFTFPITNAPGEYFRVITQ